ncbi:MAG: DNA polymerase I [Candidatus Moraniibacteriota bacterium]|nr:MAG: DNA polymerase I [Candidatus Moranbacteria bacterium]
MTIQKNNNTLLLLDGNAIIHRAFHALPPLTTKDGRIVNAVYGFSMTLLSVIEKFQPTHVVASFDLSGPTFRHEAYEGYKAKRVKAPDELYAQIPLVKEVVRAFDIPIYEKKGFEADDMIGSIAKLASKKGFRVIIVTGDNDALQLVDSNIKVFTMRRGIKDTVLFDSEKVIEKYGFSPEKIPDYKGLAGDSSDNIPGVSGIGPKTASDLLVRYGTLENIYEHLNEISLTTRERLSRDKDIAFQSKDLGTIRIDSVESVDWDSCKFSFSQIVQEKIRSHFIHFGFFSLIKRLGGSSQDKEIENKKTNASKKIHKKKFQKIICQEDWDSIEKSIRKTKLFTFEFLWKGASSRSANVEGLGLYTKELCVYIPWEKENQEKIESLFLIKDSIKITYNLKDAFHIAFCLGMQLPTTNIQDILLMAYVLFGGGNLSLEHLLLSELGQMSEFSRAQETLFVFEEKEKLTPAQEMICFKAQSVAQLYEVLVKKIQEESQEKKPKASLDHVLHLLETPLARILAEMERSGIGFDKNVFSRVSQKLEEDIAQIRQNIYDFTGREFNINSTKQLREILFEYLLVDTKNIKKTKSGYSTASSELQKLKKKYPIASKIEEYRELFKLKTTYVDVLPNLVGSDGRLRTTFNQAVTATGRLSSSEPNLQNIPIRTKLGKLLRTAFVAEEGKILVGADYSQIDLRCAAHVSEDKKMMDAFLKGEDIHTATASEVFGVSLNEVTTAMRRQAKVLNFGVLYGMGTFGFMNAAGVSRKEAQEFIEAYKKKFSGLASYLEDIKIQTKERGYVETELGRRRYVPEIRSDNAQIVASGERMAINLPIQGLAADIMKLAMIASDEVVQKYKGEIRMILQIHDELIFELPESLKEEFSHQIKIRMQDVYPLRVPLVVDIAMGKNWSEI